MKSSIPTGGMFLPNTRMSYLRQCHRDEEDPKAATRLLAYMHRKEGRSIRQTGRLLNRPYATVHRWLLHAVEGGGISGRHDAAPPGAPCRLDASQLRELRADLVAGPRRCGLESGAWTAPLVVRHVQDRFGVRYSDRGMYDLLARLGFSWRKPRPRRPKPASESAKAEFKKSGWHRQGVRSIRD